MINTRSLFLFVLLLSPTIVYSQITGREAVLLMNRGINIGDTFDAPGGETAWGNPQVQEYYFDDFKAIGINAVRLPVTWNLHTGQTSPYQIDDAFLTRVEQVIDWAMARGLFVCLNAHHEGWIKNSNECVGSQCGFTQANQDRFNAIWSQIAERFKNKPYLLMFELLNEPETMTNDHLNQIHARVYQTIRNSGGNNGKRIIVMSGTQYSASDQLVQITLPDNDHTYIIANYHSYCPWSFVSDLTGNARWGTDSDKAGVKAIFDQVKTWADQQNVAIMFNEWGASFTKHDYQSVMEFYQYYVQRAVDYSFGAFYWDDGYDFTAYERNNRVWRGDVIDVITNPILSDRGVHAVGYFDKSGISRVKSANGNYVGNIDDGDWISFRINVPQSSSYKLEIEVASTQSNGVLVVENQGGSEQYATLNIPSTGGQETWKSISATLSLKAGTQNVAFTAKTGGFNIKTLKLSNAGPHVNVTGVKISPGDSQVPLNNNFQLQAIVQPDNASNQAVSWTSSNTSVVDVDSNGVVTGKSEGVATITVTTDEGKFSDHNSITVIVIPATGIQISPSSGSVSVGKTISLQVSILPQNASYKGFSISSSDNSIASVSSDGVVTGVAQGTVNISCKSQDGGFSASASISVTKPACPQWQQGVNYKIGTVVEYNAQTYTSTNDWTGSAADPYTSTHSSTGWGWSIGGTC